MHCPVHCPKPKGQVQKSIRTQYPYGKKVFWAVQLLIQWLSYLGLPQMTIELDAREDRISIGVELNLTAHSLERITIRDGKVMLSEAIPTDKFRYPTVKINLSDLGFSFSVRFMKEHLDLFWHSSPRQSQDSGGLIGTFVSVCVCVWGGGIW